MAPEVMRRLIKKVVLLRSLCASCPLYRDGPVKGIYRNKASMIMCKNTTVGSRLILIALCQLIVNTGRISDLVRISERPINLIVLHKCGHHRQKNATTVWVSEYDIVPC